MNAARLAPLLALVLFFGIMAALEAGRRLGRRHAESASGASRAGTGAIEGAVFALLGLLIAFTFSGAAARFDERRQLVVEEANDIGTAWLRIDLLRPEAQGPLREQFRRYLDSRIESYRKLPDVAAALAEYEHSLQLQAEIWRQAVAGSREAETPQAGMLLLPALNAMIDITTTRLMASRIHPPGVIFAMLAILALAAALLAGYALSEAKSRDWLHALGFALVMSMTVYVILDIEYPRLGLIRVDAVDQVLVDLRKSMD